MRARGLLSKAEDEMWEALTGDHSEPRLRVLEVIRRVEAAQRVDDADWAAALGYFWYMLPGDEPERVCDGVRWLRHALSLEPQHALARLYLAHFEYDSGHLDSALSLLRSFGPNDFRDRGKAWRDLKIRELIHAADLRTGAANAMGISNFIAEYDASSEVDRANPDEIVAAAKIVKQRGNAAPVLERILDWARGIGYEV